MAIDDVRVVQSVAFCSSEKKAITCAGALVCPDEHVAEQLHAVQLVDGQHAIDVGALRYVDEKDSGQRFPRTSEIFAARRPLLNQGAYRLLDGLGLGLGRDGRIDCYFT
ncbi:MAG: hypothetical protein RIC38_03325 [Chromatocurvus sp.]